MNTSADDCIKEVVIKIFHVHKLGNSLSWLVYVVNLLHFFEVMSKIGTWLLY